MSKTNFAFSAPQYYDFTSFSEEDVQDLEQYFEIDHESKKDLIPISNEDDVEQEYYSVIVEDVTIIDDTKDTNSRTKLRKSFSTGNILIPWQSTQLGEERTTNNNKYQLNNSKGKKTFQNSVSSTSLYKENRPLHRVTQSYASQEWINKLAEPKYKSQSSNSCFISMAEAVQKFQKETPTRYRSKLSNKPHSASITVDHSIPKQPTIPKSPALHTKSRVRPSSIPTRNERELKEFQEAQKNKIVPHPVNRKMLRSPAPKLPVEVKPLTVPEPFHLTESKKELPKADSEDFTFHANPIPKGLFNTIDKPVIKKSSTTQPRTPALLKRYNALMQEKAMKEKKEMSNEALKNSQEGENKSNSEMKEECSEKNIKKCTEVRPFSFEERDRQVQKKKEETLQKIIEEERKMREFHAKPMPKAIYEKKVPIVETLPPKQYQVLVEKSSQKLEPSAHYFKARPAKVLQMKPFEPQKSTKHLREIPSFELNTDRRAKERQMFEEKMKYKEELIKAQRQRMEEDKIRSEEEEIANLRRVMEHKAQPIRRYKPVESVPAKSLTEPQSPHLNSNNRTRHHHNKENVTESIY